MGLEKHTNLQTSVYYRMPALCKLGIYMHINTVSVKHCFELFHNSFIYVNSNILNIQPKGSSSIYSVTWTSRLAKKHKECGAVES